MRREVDYLDIDRSSAFAYENELADSSQLLYDAWRKYSETTEKLDGLELELKILEAEIVERLYKNDPKLPKSVRAEIRKTMVPLDGDWKVLQRKIIEARTESRIMYGLVQSHDKRGDRLKEIGYLMRKQLNEDDRVYDQEARSIKERMLKAGENAD